MTPLLMTLRAVVLAAGLAALACLGGGCALLTKSKPIDIRYFTPEPVVAPGATTRAATDAKATPRLPGRQLRLGRVDAAAYLRDRIAYRAPGAEVGYYTRRRWAEPPEAFVRRALARALFEDQRLTEIVSGAGPALEVNLDAFEELRGARHAARIKLTWRLRGARTVLRQQTVIVERPYTAASGADPEDDATEALVGAMAEAMAEAVDRVVREVVVELARAGPDPSAPLAAPTVAPAPDAGKPDADATATAP